MSEHIPTNAELVSFHLGCKVPLPSIRNALVLIGVNPDHHGYPLGDPRHGPHSIDCEQAERTCTCGFYQTLAYVDAEQQYAMSEALKRIALGSRTKSDTRCDWCGSDIGDHSETPGHAGACPAAIARSAQAAEPARPNAPRPSRGWLEVNEPSAFTLEDFRRLRAEGDKEDDRKAKA